MIHRCLFKVNVRSGVKLIFVYNLIFYLPQDLHGKGINNYISVLLIGNV